MSHVCASYRAIVGASNVPALPRIGAVALHQRDSWFSFLMSPMTDTDAESGRLTPWPVASTTCSETRSQSPDQQAGRAGLGRLRVRLSLDVP
jgi:hypothetical protein